MCFHLFFFKGGVRARGGDEFQLISTSWKHKKHPAQGSLLTLGCSGATPAFPVNSPLRLNAFPNEHVHHCQHHSARLMANIAMHYSVQVRNNKHCGGRGGRKKKAQDTQSGPCKSSPWIKHQQNRKISALWSLSVDFDCTVETLAGSGW